MGGGVWLRRDLGRLRVVRDEVPRADCPVTLPAPGAGRGTACLGGVSYEIVWDVVRSEVDGTRAHVESFAAGSLAFPLTVRGWRPGDRMRLGYGSKKLKKLFLEARVPTEDRPRLPVVVDADGAVLWVPGVARSIHAPPAGEGARIHIHIIHAESD